MTADKQKVEKPREFGLLKVIGSEDHWIVNIVGSPAVDKYGAQHLHVIEYSALQSRDEEIRKLREFIADVAPSWLPEGIRLRRTQLLTQTEGGV